MEYALALNDGVRMSVSDAYSMILARYPDSYIECGYIIEVVSKLEGGLLAELYFLGSESSRSEDSTCDHSELIYFREILITVAHVQNGTKNVCDWLMASLPVSISPSP